VIDGIAYEMDERITNCINDRAVELGIGAAQAQLHVLAELPGEIAHEPRQATEDGRHLDHPDLHHDRTQGLRAALELLHRLPDPGTSDWATSDASCVRWTTSSPMQCMS